MVYSIKHRLQTGNMMISMAIALTVAAILSLASAKYAINKFNEDKGNLLGNQLQTVADALEAYIDKNNAALTTAKRASDQITITDTNLSPSIEKLKSGNFLSMGFNNKPSFGSDYIFKILVSPKTVQSTWTACTSDCNIRGFVYLSQPITTTGNTTDIRLLGAAVNASEKKHVGFSMPRNPTLITFPGGMTESNFDAGKRAGILLAVTSLTTDSNTQYWREPKATSSNLPTSNNTIGDGRFALDNYKPYVWSYDDNHPISTASWNELFSNTNTQSLSLGTLSGTILDTNQTQNVMVGHEAGKTNTGSFNTLMGFQSGNSNKGSSNVLTGHQSGYSNQGSFNVFSGKSSGYNNIYGNNNVFTGFESGYKNQTGRDNTYIGSQSGYNNISSNNTFIGSQSGKNNSGESNVFIGYQSGFNQNSSSRSTYIGFNTGSSISTGNTDENVFIGYESGKFNSNGHNNTFIGYQSGNGNKTGNYNVVIGNNADLGNSDLVNAMALGSGAVVSESNTVKIGNYSVSKVDIGNANLVTTGDITAKNITATTVNSSSDKRLKDHITNSPRDLSFIKKLRPVDYMLISNGQPQTGFIAQEVESADPDFPGIVKPQNDRDFYALTYTAFIPAIVKSIQQLDARLEKIAPTASATAATAPASVSGLANGAPPAPASADLSLLKWLVLFLSACVLSCLAVIVRFYKELQAMRLSVQRLHTLAG